MRRRLVWVVLGWGARGDDGQQWWSADLRDSGMAPVADASPAHGHPTPGEPCDQALRPHSLSGDLSTLETGMLPWPLPNTYTYSEEPPGHLPALPAPSPWSLVWRVSSVGDGLSVV